MAQPAPRYICEIAWNANPLSNPSTWVWSDETDRLRGTASWSNGKQSPLQRSETCKGRFEFDDRDRAFDPNNTGSPYYPATGKGKRPIRVRAVWDNPGAAYLDAYSPLVKSRGLGPITHETNAYYRLGETSGTGAYDDMQHADGVSVNCTLGAAGAIVGNGAYSFNGTNSQVDIADSAGWLRFTTDVSVEAWVNPATLTGDHTIWLTYVAAGFAYQVWTSGTTLIWRIYNAAGTAFTATATGVLTIGAYSHVVATYGGGDMRLYVNGALVGTNLGVGVTIRSGVGGATIGRDGSGVARWNGSIDEVALYNHPLTAAEVAAHYAARDLSSYPLFQGYFNRAKRNRVGRDATVLVEASGLLGLLATARLPASPVESEIRKSAPKAWWRLGEAALTDVVADQGGRYPGRYEGEPRLTQPCIPFSDQAGGPYFYDDGQMRVKIPNVAGAVTAYPLSFGGWFKAETRPAAFRDLFCLYGSTPTYPAFSIYMPNTGYLGETLPTDYGGVLVIDVYSGAGWSRWYHPDRTWDDGLPHHVVARLAGSATLTLVVDGVERGLVGFGGSFAYDPPTYATIGNEKQGTAGDFRSFAAQADWQMYDRYLTDAECLAQYQAGTTGWAGDTTGVRANRVLDRAGVHANLRSIANGNTVLQGGLLAGGNPSEYLQTIAKTEAGGLYETKAGILQFRYRLALLAAPFTTSWATLGNAGGAEVPFEKLQPVIGNERVVNRARIARAGGTVVERFDQASIDANGESAVEATDLLFASDNVATDYADWLIDRFGQPIPEFESLTLAPDAGDDGMTYVALGLQLEDRVTLKDRPPGGGTVTTDVFLLGEEWTLTRGAARVKWYLSKADTTEYFTLNDSTKGKLNGGYPLAF